MAQLSTELSRHVK